MSTTHPSVLHIWNTAGSASVLAKWANKLYGAYTNVYAMEKHNRFGHLTYGELCTENDARFRYHAIQKALNFDVVHIHAYDRLALKMRKCLPKKPIVLHYHGSDIRGNWRRKKRFWENADMVLVSTIGLLNGAPEEATYFPNPVDTDLFYPNSHPNDVDPNSALTLRYGAVDVAEELAAKHGLDLTIHRRNKQFLEMPSLFRQFGWYIDTKRKNGVLMCRSWGSGSLTGLEASACGLKVINSEGEIREELPSQHRAENAVKTLRPIYMSLME